MPRDGEGRPRSVLPGGGAPRETLGFSSLRDFQLAATGACETAAGAVVARLLRPLHHAIAAERSELAPDVALAVAAVVHAVVALFAKAQDAIAANCAAVTGRGFEAR